MEMDAHIIRNQKGSGKTFLILTLPSYSMDEEAVGIITMEDVMEELLQVGHILNCVLIGL
jgi:Flp pilus assembly CpaF family ATPase